MRQNEKAKDKKNIKKIWKEWRLTIFFIVFVIIPVKSSLADWNWVPTGSMNPTILEGDLIFVNKMAYDLRLPLTLHSLVKFSDPKRGDIVVCFSPEDDTRLVKRVIALPGDTIELRNNALFLNSLQLTYSQINSEQPAYISSKQREGYILAQEYIDGVEHAIKITPSVRAMRNFASITIPKDSYFVMGDNRDNSRDSRYFGFVQRKLIVGKAKGIIVSFDIKDKYQPRLKRFFTKLN